MREDDKMAAKTKTSKKSAGKSVKSALAKSALGGALKIAGTIKNKVAAGKGLKLGSGKRRGGAKGFGMKRKSVKLRLKKEYDKRALRKIRMGNLGGARRDLRKKATVI